MRLVAPPRHSARIAVTGMTEGGLTVYCIVCERDIAIYAVHRHPRCNTGVMLRRHERERLERMGATRM
jgi:hypothetical protein